jgi:hypothetical protein
MNILFRLCSLKAAVGSLFLPAWSVEQKGIKKIMQKGCQKIVANKIILIWACIEQNVQQLVVSIAT